MLIHLPRKASKDLGKDFSPKKIIRGCAVDAMMEKMLNHRNTEGETVSWSSFFIGPLMCAEKFSSCCTWFEPKLSFSSFIEEDKGQRCRVDFHRHSLTRITFDTICGRVEIFQVLGSKPGLAQNCFFFPSHFRFLCPKNSFRAVTQPHFLYFSISRKRRRPTVGLP